MRVRLARRARGLVPVRALSTDPGGYRQTFIEVLVQAAGSAGCCSTARRNIGNARH